MLYLNFHELSAMSTQDIRVDLENIDRSKSLKSLCLTQDICIGLDSRENRKFLY
jgi:hypothetical protein